MPPPKRTSVSTTIALEHLQGRASELKWQLGDVEGAIALVERFGDAMGEHLRFLEALDAASGNDSRRREKILTILKETPAI